MGTGSLGEDGDNIGNPSMIESMLKNEDGFSNSELPKLKVIKPIYLSYAKASKKVDVKRLKDNIWQKLLPSISSGNEDFDSENQDQEGESLTKDNLVANSEAGLNVNGDQQNFSEIVEELKTMYPQNKLDDISVSFCFICLLHLANEKNLVIESSQDMTDLKISNTSSSI
ncbi:hypothetical protein BB559_003803 [Furculomyces boomerangus]|uniref:Condensin complex subunit 2 n=1 Tax=Furculomyces boomerangus TaxID=61424 RepID=A0A2T9YIR1_9FUNG|nr:hypothetical protein BB559_003803 [Furculomyces boomerangus]